MPADTRDLDGTHLGHGCPAPAPEPGLRSRWVRGDAIQLPADGEATGRG